MYLNRIKAVNFKIGSFDQPLTRVTVICGLNATGKSSRAEGCILTTARFIPGLPKTARGLFDALATGNPMRVTSQADDGRVFSGEWREKGDKVTYTEVGETIVPNVMADAGEFLSLSGPDRVKYIFARCKVDLSIEKLTLSICANVKNISLEENTPNTEAAIQEVCREVGSVAKNDLEEDLSPQEFIADLVDCIKEKLRLANENAKRMSQTVQGLTQIKEESGASGDIEQRLATARAALDTANGEVARLKQVGVQLKADIEAAEATEKTAVDETAVQKQMSELEAKRPVSVHPAGEKPVARKMATVRPVSKSEADAQAAAIEAANAANRAKNDARERIETLESDIEDAGKQTNCPTCGHDIKGKQKKVVSDLKKALKDAKAVLKEKTELYNTAQTVEAKAIEVYNAATDAIAKWDTNQATMLGNNNADLDAWNTRVTAFNDFQSALNKFTSDMNTLKSSLDGNVAAREAAAKLPSLRQKIEQARADYVAALATGSTKARDVDALDTEYRALVKQRAEASSRATALEEAAKHKAEATVLKEVVALLHALQEEIIAKSVQPILDAANQLCEGILRLPLALVDGEIGMQGPTGFVGHKTLSDSEKLLCYASLSLALAADAPFKLAVIGRFESFDYANRLKLIDRCLELVASGKLDQCLFVEVSGAQNPAVGYENYNDNPNFSLVQI